MNKKVLLARAALLVIGCLLIYALYAALTGAKPEILLGIFFCLIIFPCLIYVVQLVFRLLAQRKDGSRTKDAGKD